MPSRTSRGGGERPELSVSQALLLGALHGPAELLPISSSGHVTAIPWLLGWRYAELDDELRKSFEVALHAGTLAALTIALRDGPLGPPDRRRIATALLSAGPPAAAGLLLERPVERRLGTPVTVAAGLVVGAAALAAADRAPQRRTHREAAPSDALWLGLAQACALFPGVSRSGATVAAARWRGFTRTASGRLSSDAALPVIAGAVALKGLRLRRRGLDARTALTFAAGGAASFASTLLAARLVRRQERDRSLLPYAAYRVGLAAAMIARLREQGDAAHA